MSVCESVAADDAKVLGTAFFTQATKMLCTTYLLLTSKLEICHSSIASFNKTQLPIRNQQKVVCNLMDHPVHSSSPVRVRRIRFLSLFALLPITPVRHVAASVLGPPPSSVSVLAASFSDAFLLPTKIYFPTKNHLAKYVSLLLLC